MKVVQLFVVILAVSISSRGLAYETWMDAGTGIKWTYTVQDDGTISLGSGYSDPTAVPVDTRGELEIPPKINGRVVTSVGRCAFWHCNGLTSVRMPQGVLSIGQCAFESCSGLVSLEIPEGVTHIGFAAFDYCSGLTSVTIPASVTSVEEDAFSGCRELKSVYISNLSAWCGIVFKGVAANPLYCAERLCIDGEEVVDLQIPDDVTSIGDYAFSWWKRLRTVTIPMGVKSIGRGAFCTCVKVTAIDVPHSVTNIGDEAFAYSGLTSVTIPSSMESVSDGVFLQCQNLSFVKIPPTVKSIGDSAFAWCGELTSVSIPSSVTNIGNSAFEHCSELSSLMIPEGVLSIGNASFRYCYGLTSVVVPSSVTKIGADAFEWCTNIKSAILPEGFAMSKVFPQSYSGMTSVAIPANATYIVDCAFSGCGKVLSLDIPSTVTHIGASAFEGCGELIAVTIPASVRSIGSFAFSGCAKIKEIQIPDGVGALSGYVLEGCEGLTTVGIPNSVSNVSSTAFKDCGNIASVTMPGRFAMKDIFPSSYSKIQDVTILDGEEALQKEAFAGCSMLSTVVISEGVTTLGEDLFYNFTNLRELTIPSTVTSIGGYALNGCLALKTIHVSNNGDIDALKQMLYESGFDTTGVTFDHVDAPVVVSFRVTFDACGGSVAWTEAEVVSGEVVGELPTAMREGCEFLGWFTAAVGGTKVTVSMVVTKNVTFYAQWQKIGGEEDPAPPPVEPPEEPVEPEPPVGPTTPTNAPPTVVDEAETRVDVEKGEVAPFETAAAVYDGFLYDGETVIGTVQVKVAKGKKDKSGVFSAKVTATVQMAGESKKLSFKGGVADAKGNVTDMTDKDGNKLAVTVGVNGLGGGFIEAALPAVTYRIDGARNVFSGKSEADKDAAGEAVRLYKGVYNVALDGGTLSVSVDKKGKAKIAGTVEGNKVSATSQLVVGKDAAVMPVVIVKKVNVAFCLWVMADGTVEARGIEGAIADRPSTLKAGAKFVLDVAAAKGLAALPGLYGEYLPNGIDVAANGTKWIVAGGVKAGKVAFVKGGNTVDESKLGANPSGLKLTYKQKDGTFKGSFKVYCLEGNGKIKAYTASVTGVMIDTKGYGTATIKKPACTFPITIE